LLKLQDLANLVLIQAMGLPDGVFVYTGFRPKYIMIKNSGGGATSFFTRLDYDGHIKKHIQSNC
jgi:hypothetical protein